MARYIKINWKSPESNKYAIIQVLEDHDSYITGKLIYGSRRKYEDSGKIFNFTRSKYITELDRQYIVDNYFLSFI
jgi:hypothetical protein